MGGTTVHLRCLQPGQPVRGGVGSHPASSRLILIVQVLYFYATSEVVTDMEYEHVHQLVDEIAAQEGSETSGLLLQAAPLSDRYSIGTTSL